MTYLVAAIEHHARKLANAVTRALVEKCSGYSDYEAGDFLAAPGPNIHGYRLDYPESPLVEREAEEEVAEPYWGEPSRCPNAGRMCNCTGACLRPQSPAASAGRGESSSRAVSDVPPSPARERGCSCVEVPHNYCARHGAALGAHPMPTDPSPTIASRQHQPSVDGEGSPLDSAIPPAPRGERPDWPTSARIRDHLRQHFNARTLGIGVPAELITEAAGAILADLSTQHRKSK